MLFYRVDNALWLSISRISMHFQHFTSLFPWRPRGVLVSATIFRGFSVCCRLFQMVSRSTSLFSIFHTPVQVARRHLQETALSTLFTSIIALPRSIFASLDFSKRLRSSRLAFTYWIHWLLRVVEPHNDI